MINQKILIVTQAFFPENSPRSFRATELAKEFSRQGHQVTIITPRKGHLQNALAEQYSFRIKDMGEYSWKPLQIKGQGPERLMRRAIVRMSNLLFEYPGIQLSGLVKKSLNQEKDYDLLVSIAVPFPIHWGVAAVRNDKKPIAKVWVADCGDPYMGNKADSFRKIFYFKYVEKWFCKKADYITVPTEGSIAAYYPEFHEKIKVIPQGFNFDETKIAEGPVDNPVTTFGYAGGFIPGIRDPKDLIEFLCNYKSRFKFIIFTSNGEMVKPFIAEGDDRFVIRPYIPREELLYELSKMDFLVNINNGTSVQTPSKLIDYALTMRPILSIESGTTDLSIVDDFLKGNYERQLQIPDLEAYDIKNVARKFLELSGSTITQH